jgi:hypothetical protein
METSDRRRAGPRSIQKMTQKRHINTRTTDNNIKEAGNRKNPQKVKKVEKKTCLAPVVRKKKKTCLASDARKR